MMEVEGGRDIRAREAPDARGDETPTGALIERGAQLEEGD